MNRKMAGLLLGVVTLMATLAVAQQDPMVGGQAMYPSKNIIENAVNSPDHTTLVAAVKAAGLVHIRGRRSVHGICADERSVQQASGGHGR